VSDQPSYEPVNLADEADSLMADLLEQAATLLNLKEVAE
jgi:hypothetical protein